MSAAPSKLYRYRPLDDALLDRELGALRDSYLYAPPFSAMNDPMEAFYEMGGAGDWLVDAVFQGAGKKISDLYAMLDDMIGRFALVSFSSTHENLPMWAYYASNFAGMCLEFDAPKLAIGDFQNEALREVGYARNALGPLSFADLANGKLEEAVIARITRKRLEWSHEKEWRFVTGEVGPKHYLDNALTKVFLGPRAKPEHVARVCEVLSRRPVEVLQGKISRFELSFETIKTACPHDECERIGAGQFTTDDLSAAGDELEKFLAVPMQALEDKCLQIAMQPNMDQFIGIGLAVDDPAAMYLSTVYKLRSGRSAYHLSYLDRKLAPRKRPA